MCYEGDDFSCCIIPLPFCFCARGLVEVLLAAGGAAKEVEAHDVKAGDRVRTMHGFQRVVYVHKGGVASTIIRIQFQGPDGQTGTIGLTPHHLIYTTGDDMKKAHELRVGDALQLQSGPATITGLATEAGPVRSLITANGELLVDGVRVSSYAFDDRLHLLTRGVAWLGRVDARLPDRLCRAVSPAMVRWVLPLWVEELHEYKKAVKATGKATEKERSSSSRNPHKTLPGPGARLLALQRLTGPLAA